MSRPFQSLHENSSPTKLSNTFLSTISQNLHTITRLFLNYSRKRIRSTCSPSTIFLYVIYKTQDSLNRKKRLPCSILTKGGLLWFVSLFSRPQLLPLYTGLPFTKESYSSVHCLLILSYHPLLCPTVYKWKLLYFV